MSGERVPRRRPASEFPEITGIRLSPVGVGATLLNLSPTGVLVECASRVVPGTTLTVLFDGTFLPASAEGRVIRCEVTGIAADGALRFHLGLAFSTRIPLSCDADEQVDPVATAPLPPPRTAGAAVQPILRNRW